MERKVKKRILLCICMSICAIIAAMGTAMIHAGTASAAADNFVIENGVLKEYNGSAIVVEVPHGVKQVSQKAFRGRKDTERVILPDSVEYIVPAD